MFQSQLAHPGHLRQTRDMQGLWLPSKPAGTAGRVQCGADIRGRAPYGCQNPSSLLRFPQPHFRALSETCTSSEPQSGAWAALEGVQWAQLEPREAPQEMESSHTPSADFRTLLTHSAGRWWRTGKEAAPAPAPQPPSPAAHWLGYFTPRLTLLTWRRSSSQTSKGTSGSQRLHGAQPGSGHHRFQHRLTPDRGAQGSADSCTRSNESTLQPAQVLWYDYL